jgi:hypothetical protein
MSLVVDEHRAYLSDDARVTAYRRARNAIVTPGSVGLDLASGTGILGLLACQAGAARIYAIESDDIAGLAQRLAAENGFGDRIITIQEWSTRVQLPERVDFIVTDLAGRFGFEAGLLELVDDARRRFLKPGGALVPSAVTLFIAPVSCSEARAHVDFWAEPLHGLSFGAAYEIAQSTGYPRHLSTSDLLAPAVTLTSANLHDTTTTLSGRGDFVIARAARLDGIGGWFSATLAAGVELTNTPGDPSRINRRNVFFPLQQAVDVESGDRATVSMFIRPELLVVRWRVEVRRNDALIHTTDTSTFSGMLLSPQSKERTQPGFRPALTAAGEARRTVVNMCDGGHTIAEIEQELLKRHADVVRSDSEAAVFVAEVVTRYAR